MMVEEKQNNKKTLILSILGVLILIIAVVGVSYAMYTFSASGTKENVISTGVVVINFDNSDLNFDGEEGADATGQLTLTNQYPMTDDAGMGQEDPNNILGFTVSAKLSGNIKIVYDLGIDEGFTPGDTLTEEFIKVALYEYKNNQPELVTETPSTIKDLKDKTGVEGCLSSYVLTNGEFTGTGSESTEQKKNYVVKAWVADTYDLPVDPETGTSDTNNEDGSVTHESHTTPETFTFKIKLVAEQATK